MSITILAGDAMEQVKSLPSESVQCCVTSPPYWGLRDYGMPGQMGCEATYPEYVRKMAALFEEVRRVLRADGTLWLNLGDCYATGAGKACSPGGGKQGKEWQGPNGYRGAHDGDPKNPNGIASFQPNRMPQPGLKSKDLVGIPWRVAFALQDAGWYLRSDIIWHKPNPMPESVTDRPTKSHEYIFLLTKSERYYYDATAIREESITQDARKPYCPGQVDARGNGHDRSGGSERSTPEAGAFRNKRTVWTVPTFSYSEAHFATYPPDLIKPCILAGTKPGDTVLDPFGGSGTTGQVAIELGRKAVLIELNPEYVKLIEQRCDVTPGFAF